MVLEGSEKARLIEELACELNAKLDGGRKNLIVPVCPYCGKSGGKFGIYVGADVGRKKAFVSHCFSCGHTTKDVNRLLSDIGREDLVIEAHATPDYVCGDEDELSDDGIDDTLVEVAMPYGYKRCYKNAYLKSRGFTFDDYEYFPVGTTMNCNFKYDDYVVFQITDDGAVVGYVARHTWNKSDIDKHNTNAKMNGRYQILRYNNSRENDFSKLLYNYDSVICGETDTVVIVEGVFDVISLTRKLDLYDNRKIAVVATFGKKISDIQIYKLQQKGVGTIVLGYDSDAFDASCGTADKLNEFFDVYVANIVSDGKDWDEMDYEDIYKTFAYNLCTSVEFKINSI